MEVPNSAKDTDFNNVSSHEVKFGKTLLENWVEEVMANFFQCHTVC